MGGGLLHAGQKDPTLARSESLEKSEENSSLMIVTPPPVEECK